MCERADNRVLTQQVLFRMRINTFLPAALHHRYGTDSSVSLHSPIASDDESANVLSEGTSSPVGSIRSDIDIAAKAIISSSTPHSPQQRELQQQNNSGSSLRRIRVLIAEDDPFCLEVEITMLEQCGCSVLGFERGNSLVDYFKTEGARGVELILMDSHMPGMTG